MRTMTRNPLAYHSHFTVAPAGATRAPAGHVLVEVYDAGDVLIEKRQYERAHCPSFAALYAAIPEANRIVMV